MNTISSLLFSKCQCCSIMWQIAKHNLLQPKIQLSHKGSFMTGKTHFLCDKKVRRQSYIILKWNTDLGVIIQYKFTVKLRKIQLCEGWLWMNFRLREKLINGQKLSYIILPVRACLNCTAKRFISQSTNFHFLNYRAVLSYLTFEIYFPLETTSFFKVNSTHIYWP